MTSAAAVILPGVLVAATGVGAGDLNTAGLAGRELGLAVLWACALGAMLKFVVTEGLMRWQLATGETLLGGAIRRMGWWVAGPFALYAGLWTVIVGAALVSACGTTAEAMLRAAVPSAGEGSDGFQYGIGIVHALAAAILVTLGGFRVFERVMAALVGLMFLAVVVSVVLIGPDWLAIMRGLAIPSVPAAAGGADRGDFSPISRTVALIGGVGGTLTVLAYGYWIREHGRSSTSDLRLCRLDIGVGYACTALFAMGVLVIGATVGENLSGSGNLMEQLSAVLADEVGEPLRWVFLVGAWCAVFSSVLGVWQCVPMIWCDWLGAIRTRNKPLEPVNVSGSRHNVFRRQSPRTYLLIVWLMVLAPMLVGAVDFVVIQLTYGVVGACFLPMLAVGLIVMNGRAGWVGDSRNRLWSVLALLATIVFFAWYGIDRL